MSEKRDTHECSNTACQKRFAVVCRHEPGKPLLPLHLSCPHCGRPDFFLVATSARTEPDGTYVMSLDYRVEPVEA